jgi:hypothetical protein
LRKRFGLGLQTDLSIGRSAEDAAEKFDPRH